jgi:hypothetical protein
MRSRDPRRALAVVAVLGAALAGCGTWAEDDDSSTRSGTPLRAAVTSPARVVAVGDIACAPGEPVTATTCRQAATARLASNLEPDAVLALGDLQYPKGSLSDFQQSYDASWGTLRSRTWPVPGNHEYYTPGASGYYTYFADRQPGAPGYYARTLGTWRAYFLNSNCDRIDCAAEADWLARDLAAHPRRCSLVVTHHPRWSSGEHGNSTSVARFYRIAFNHHVELLLSGHDHHYERFVPKRPDGTRAPRGVVQFVSGTGGKSFYPANDVVAGSAYRIANRFGVLALSLRKGSYTWAWKGIGGATRDAGARDCT